MTTATTTRELSFGQGYRPTWVDRFGVWLSAVQIRRQVPSFEGLRVGDFGCGYHAAFARTVQPRCRSLVLVDVALSEEVKALPRVTAIEAGLPRAIESIGDGALDVVLCTSVLEHLWEPLECLTAIHRVLDRGGIALINVPSWRGKKFLELSAFRLGLSPAREMDDHKTYYDVKDLWPLLIRAGFQPSGIKCFPHKFGLNTFAACRRPK